MIKNTLRDVALKHILSPQKLWPRFKVYCVAQNTREIILNTIQYPIVFYEFSIESWKWLYDKLNFRLKINKTLLSAVKENYIEIISVYKESIFLGRVINYKSPIVLVQTVDAHRVDDIFMTTASNY